MRLQPLLERMVITFTCSIGASIGYAQDGPSDPQQSPGVVAFNRAYSQGDYLSAVQELESLEDKDKVAWQLLATARSFVGDIPGAHEAMDRQRAMLQQLPLNRPVDIPDGLTPLSAIDAIVEQAREHQIVILNEAHHVPQHRALSLQLARKLREQGFTYFAAETFAPGTFWLRVRGYPIQGTGFYSSEPVFGELIRQTLKIGFQPVAYEAVVIRPASDMADGINTREAAQCENLIKNIFSKDPDAKVLIHVGHDHVMERPRKVNNDREIRWMAARLAEETGLDPLTIDQTIQTERSTMELATNEWRYALERGWLTEPVVLKQSNGQFFIRRSFRNMVDMQVFHPPTKIVEGRPNWLTTDEGRIAVSVPTEAANEAFFDDSGPILIQAFLENEGRTAIPVDQFLWQSGEPLPKLMLRPGKYRIVANSRGGMQTLAESINVDEND